MQAADRKSNIIENAEVGSRPMLISSRILAAATVLLLVGSVILNVVLARKVQSLRRVQALESAERLLKIGTTVPPLTVKRLGGQQEVVTYQGTNRPTVLYIFTPL